MRKPFFIAGVLLVLAATPYSSAQRESLLPVHFGAWSKGYCPAKPPTTVLAEETGQIDNAACEFTFNGQTVGVWAGSFRDPSSGYEVYTSEISPGMQPSTLGQNSAIDGEKLLMLVGRVVLRVERPRSVPAEDLQQLIASLHAHADQTPLPPIRGYLPEGFMDGTQRYALGPKAFLSALSGLRREEFSNLADEVGFGDSKDKAETMIAEYRNGKDSAALLLIDYPTPQLAEQHLRHLEQAVSPAAKQAGTTIERKGSILTLVLNPSSVAYGSSLRSAVNYETAVTWNEPHQTITDPPILTTLSKIFIGTGIFMVVAVVMGLAFGGVRVMAKIFFPGKFFDRPEQMEVLQLGLSGKRIDPRDFY